MGINVPIHTVVLTQLTKFDGTKMRRLRWIICRKELHDMLGLCSWMAPWVVSPNKSENYIGDDDMEGKVYRALTGRNTTAKQLDDAGFRCIAPTPCAK